MSYIVVKCHLPRQLTFIGNCLRIGMNIAEIRGAYSWRDIIPLWFDTLNVISTHAESRGSCGIVYV